MQIINFSVEYARKSSKLIQKKAFYIVSLVTIQFAPVAQIMRRSYGLENDPINSCIYYLH